MGVKICESCGKEKAVQSAFRKRGKSCDSCLQKKYFRDHPEKQRQRAYIVRQTHVDRAILADCRQSDRKNGRTGNDLDRDFVQSQISKGCTYCGETGIRITLDRIDNSLAHSKLNVVSSCIRCNYIRGSMPYGAWLHMVPAVKEARLLGLFGEWRSVPFNLRPPSSPIPKEIRPRPTLSTLPPVEEVRTMVESTSLRAAARALKCSHVSIWKYLHNTPQ